MKIQSNEKDPRVIRTQQLIQDAFVSLLAEKEFQDITIGDITKRATINRSTFYAHFDDKYALMESFLMDKFIIFVSEKIQLQSEITAEMLKRLILCVCDYHEGLRIECKLKIQSVMPLFEIKFKTKLEQIVNAWLTESVKVLGVERKRVDLLAIMIVQAIYSVTYRWNIEERKTSPVVLADIILPFLLGGIMAMMNKDEISDGLNTLNRRLSGITSKLMEY